MSPGPRDSPSLARDGVTPLVRPEMESSRPERGRTSSERTFRNAEKTPPQSKAPLGPPAPERVPSLAGGPYGYLALLKYSAETSIYFAIR